METMQIFEHEQFGKVRMILIDGEPWFVGKDVAAALGYGDGNEKSKALTNALADHVDAEDKKLLSYNDFKRYQNGDLKNISHYGAIVINESGVYSLVFSSRLPDAKQFSRWVRTEVLPSIRKTGSYSANNAYSLPKDYPSALRALADEVEKTQGLLQKIERDAPKVAFANNIHDMNDNITVEQFSKQTHDRFKLGRNKMFQKLREMKILKHDNFPYQNLIESGYLKVIEREINNHAIHQTVITGKGQLWLYQRLSEYLELPYQDHLALPDHIITPPAVA